MPSAYMVSGQPVSEPITVEEAAAFTRVDFPDENGILAGLIKSARQYAEAITHKALATQTLTCIETIVRPSGGELSGPITRGPNWYEYQEQLGANPFGAAMFYFDLPMPPVQQINKIETRTTVWEPWVQFNGNTTLDAVPEPSRLYFQVPVTANQWRFQYVTGYDSAPSVNRPLPEDIKLCMLELIAFWFDHREGETLPNDIMRRLMIHKVDWV